jgi:DNA-binding beta-propeller fold protein YncE
MKSLAWWDSFLACCAAIAIAAPLAAAQTPSPALLVLNKAESALVIVDPRDGKIVGRVPTGEAPHEVAASTDGQLAFVSNYGSREPGSSISVIDIPGRKELRRFDLGPLRRPHGIAFAEGKVYFTAETNKLIARYDPYGPARQGFQYDLHREYRLG